jgi:chemotaxis protein MotB
MAGAGGGAWKVAYADFVTAMMAFFMVMWLTTQKQGVKEAVAGYFRDPFATFKSTEKGAAATASPVTDPMYGHTSQPQKRKLKISGDSTDYQFTVLFTTDDATIDAGQLDYIKNFAPMMVGKLNRIEIRGHTIRSPLPEGSQYADHWQLCYVRCQAVRKELESLGIERERIRLSQAEGNEPLSRNLDKDELKLNSRVDVILLPDLADVAWDRPSETSAPTNVAQESDVNVGMSQADKPAPEKSHDEKKQGHEGDEAAHESDEHVKSAETDAAKSHDASEHEPATHETEAPEAAPSAESANGHSPAGEKPMAEQPHGEEPQKLEPSPEGHKPVAEPTAPAAAILDPIVEH